MNLADTSAERAVLAGVARFNSAAFVDADSILNVNTFTDDVSQVVWKCVKKIFEENSSAKLDVPSILSAASELGLKDKLANETRYLGSLFNFGVELNTVGKLCKKLRKLQIARDAVVVAQGIQADLFDCKGDESVSNIVGKLESPIFNFVSSLVVDKRDETVLLAEGLEQRLDYLEANPTDTIGIKTGYPCYDLSIGGSMERGTVHMIFARVKTGKSMLVDNIGMYVAGTLGIPVLNLDTEMSQEKHQNRVLANMTGISINEIKSGKYSLDPKKREKVRAASLKLATVPYSYRCVSSMEFEEIISIARRWVVKDVGLDRERGCRKDCLIIYDWLRISTGLKGDTKEHQALGFQLSALHDFAVSSDIPILTFGQLNRDGIDTEDTSAIAGSDRLSWFADSCSMFKKKTPEEIVEDGPEKGNRKMISLVSRDCDMWEQENYINYMMRGEFGRIEEINLMGNKTKEDTIEVSDEDDECPF